MNILSLPGTALAWLGRQGTRALAVSIFVGLAVPQLAASPGPTYLRLLRGQVPTVLDEYDYTFELGKAKVLRGGADVVLISSGLMTMRALQAATELAKHRVDVAVVHTPTLKPFDADTCWLKSIRTGWR